MVTAIMPTADRHAFLPVALECFLRQDFAEPAELLIVDDGVKPCEALIPHQAINRGRVRYVRLEGPKRSTGAKRNLCCELARGEIIVHWDDDDWSSAFRLSHQVNRLRRLRSQGKLMTGFHTMLYWDQVRNRGFRYHDKPAYVSGTGQVYFRSWWERTRFNEVDEKGQPRNVGEDTDFSFAASQAGVLDSEDAGQLMVARIHGCHTSPKNTDCPQYKAAEPSEFPAEFFADTGLKF